MPVIETVVPAIVAPVVAIMRVVPTMVMSIMVAPVVKMPLAIARRVHVPVPVIANEVHRTSASVVPPAVILPATCVARRNDQVDWRRRPVTALDHHWLAVDEPRATVVNVADIQLPVETGLAHAERDAHVRKC